MENNKEQQNSTEQYYSNIESSIEEQSYSLEDLHPEEKKVEYKTIESSSIEVQPDPTIIDGVKETIGDKYANISHPKIPTVAFSQNNLEKMPMISHTNQYNNNVPKQPSIIAPDSKNEVPNAKVFYLIFGCIILFFLIAFPIYSSREKIFSNNSGTSEAVSNNNNEVVNDDDKTITNEENNPKEDNQHLQSISPIEFDMTLSFDKGFISNEKEIKQKNSFLPTNLTGIVRCDLEQPEVTSGITKYASTYLYYENYKLKQAITVTKQKYPEQTTYSEAKNTTLIYKEASDNSNTIDVIILQDDSTYTITNKMKYNLENGSSTYIESIDSYLKFSSDYDTDIKSAIDNIINLSNKGNTICSAINTNEAGL